MKEFEREEKQAIIDTNRRLRGESKPMMNPTDRIKTLGRVIEKAKIGKPVNYKHPPYGALPAQWRAGQRQQAGG